MRVQTLRSWVVIAALAVLPPTLAGAQEDPPDDPKAPSLEEIIRLLDQVVPEQIGEDNTELVKKLMEADMGPPISQSFNAFRALNDIFDRRRPNFSPNCRRLISENGEPDGGYCTASRGEAAGPGEFEALKFSKQPGLGNIKYVRRATEVPVDPDKLEPVRLTDEQAYEKALGFLVDTLGLPRQQLPLPPAGLVVPLPVKDLILASGDEKGEVVRAIPVQKVVSFQRGLLVNLPDLPYVRAPGDAMVAMDDSGMTSAMIRDWQDLRPHPGVDPRNAMTRSQLVEALATRIARSNKGPIANLSSQLVISSVPMPSYGLLLPAVQVWVSPVLRDATEEQQREMWSTAGIVHEIPLVKIAELEPGADDD